MKTFIATLVVSILLITGKSASADTTTGALSGFLFGGLPDRNYHALVGAHVTAISGSQDIETTTDQHGYFCFISLNPGPLSIRIQATGFFERLQVERVVAGVTHSILLWLCPNDVICDPAPVRPQTIVVDSSQTMDVFNFDETGNLESELRP